MNDKNNNSLEPQNAHDTATYSAIKRLAIPESMMPVKDIPELLVENRRVCMEMAKQVMQQMAIQLHQQGLSTDEIARRVNCTVRNVQLILKNEKKRNFSHNNGGGYLGNKDGINGCTGKAQVVVEELPPALELLRKELYNRYGQNLTEAEFMPHFSIAVQRLYTPPNEEQVRAEFSAPLSPDQDEMYRTLLDLD